MQVTLTVTVDDLPALLRLWSTHARLSLRDLAERASALLPGEQTVSYMLAQRYLDGQWPKAGPEPLVLAALVHAMGRNLTELPAEYLAIIDEAQRALSYKVETPTPPLRPRNARGPGRLAKASGSKRERARSS